MDASLMCAGLAEPADPSGIATAAHAGVSATTTAAAPRDHERREVLWCGGTAPLELVGALAGCGCQHRAVAFDADAVAASASTARGLIIEVPAEIIDATAWAAPVIEMALAHGLGVVLTMATGADLDPLHVDVHRVQQFVAAVEGLVHPETEPRVIYSLPQWGRISRWITEVHRAGPALNAALRLEGDVPTDPEALMLLRRAFHDLSAVSLTQLQGGKSGAGVWGVTPSVEDAARRASPFLVKYNTLRKTRLERSRYSQYADERVSFRLRPPLHPARCVEGPKHGLLVFDFIERAIPFRTALLTYPPGRLVGSLFGHTLAGCLRSAVEVDRGLVEPFERIKALHWSDGLRAAAARARIDLPHLPDVDALRAQIAALRPVRHRVATAHGDLHSGNLLVAAGSSDVLLIDFGSIEFGMPVATDPACLEVSVAFAPADVAEELGGRVAPAADAEWLRGTYRFPLEPFAVPERRGCDAWLADAVRAIRAADRQLEADPVPYAVAVASYLVRYAAYPDNGSDDDRALAYELACGLIGAVRDDLARRGAPAASVADSETCLAAPACGGASA